MTYAATPIRVCPCGLQFRGPYRYCPGCRAERRAHPEPRVYKLELRRCVQCGRWVHIKFNQCTRCYRAGMRITARINVFEVMR
jgi:hypothetical protein